MFAAYHQMCQPTTSSSTPSLRNDIYCVEWDVKPWYTIPYHSSSTVSTSRRADALPPTGSVHLAGQGRPGYNRWKRIAVVIGAGSLVVEVAMALAGQAQQ